MDQILHLKDELDVMKRDLENKFGLLENKFRLLENLLDSGKDTRSSNRRDTRSSKSDKNDPFTQMQSLVSQARAENKEWHNSFATILNSFGARLEAVAAMPPITQETAATAPQPEAASSTEAGGTTASSPLTELSLPPAASQEPDDSSTSAASAGEYETAASSPLTEVGSIPELSSPDLDAGRSPPPKQGSLSLAVEDMGESLVPHLKTLIEQGGFAGAVSVENLPEVDWETVAQSSRQPEEEFLYSQQCTPTIGGCCTLRSSPAVNFEFPDLFNIEPPEADIRSFLQEFISNASEPALYYVGSGLTADFDSLLHPGDLAQICGRLGIADLRGIASMFWHLGERGSATAWHREDGPDYRSCSIVLAGWKDWIRIRNDYAAKFTAFIRRHWTTGTCDQAIRHLSVLVSPDQLDKEGIEYELRRAGPGDMIVTEPGEYHAIVNSTSCLALSINFVLVDEEIIPEGIRVCEGCGLYQLVKDNLIPGFIVDDTGAPSNGARRHGTMTLRKRPNNSDEPQEHSIGGPSQARSRKRKKTTIFAPQMTVLAGAVSGQEALSRLCFLIESWTNKSTCFELDGASNDKVKLVSIIQKLEGAERLAEFLRRLAQARLAEIIDERRGNRRQIDSQTIDNLLGAVGWENTKALRKKLHGYLDQGRKWNKLCGDSPGLLCLIPPNREDKQNPGAKGQDYQELGPGAIRTLHDSLKGNDLACRMLQKGGEFQQCIWQQKTVPMDISKYASSFVEG